MLVYLCGLNQLLHVLSLSRRFQLACTLLCDMRRLVACVGVSCMYASWANQKSLSSVLSQLTNLRGSKSVYSVFSFRLRVAWNYPHSCGMFRRSLNHSTVPPSPTVLHPEPPELFQLFNDHDLVSCRHSCGCFKVSLIILRHSCGCFLSQIKSFSVPHPPSRVIS